MNAIPSLETTIHALKRRDRAFFKQFDAILQKENAPVEIQWSLKYDEKHFIDVEWVIHVLLKEGFVSFVKCSLTQDKQDIAWCMDLRSTDITVVKQGDYNGWLSAAYHPVVPVEVKASIFGYVNAPNIKTQFFTFEKTIKIEPVA